jgi:hypothetical protein
MARYRSRLRANEIVAPVVVTHLTIELLISTGWLDIEQSENRNAVGAAISAMVRDAASRT